MEVASDTLLRITPETQDLIARFDYTVKKAGIFATQIELPAGLPGHSSYTQSFVISEEGRHALARFHGQE